MPNYVKNRITLLERGKEIVEELKDVLSKNDKGELSFDFNKLIPMPKSLDIESSSSMDDYFKVYLNTEIDNQKTFDKLIKLSLKNTFFTKKEDYILTEEQINKICEKEKLSKEEILKLGKQVADNLLNYGSKDWYNWCIDNWGTKWNACDSEIYDDTIEFDTAWDFAEPIAKALFKKYPNLNMKWEFSEEQISVYGGYMKQVNGKITLVEFEEDTKELYELAFDLWGCGEDFVYNEDTGTYEYWENYEEDEEEN